MLLFDILLLLFCLLSNQWGKTTSTKKSTRPIVRTTHCYGTSLCIFCYNGSVLSEGPWAKIEVGSQSPSLTRDCWLQKKKHLSPTRRIRFLNALHCQKRVGFLHGTICICSADSQPTRPKLFGLAAYSTCLARGSDRIAPWIHNIVGKVVAPLRVTTFLIISSFKSRCTEIWLVLVLTLATVALCPLF